MRRNIVKQNRYTCKRRVYAMNTNSLGMMYAPIYRAQWWIWDRLEHVWVVHCPARRKGEEDAKRMSASDRQVRLA